MRVLSKLGVTVVAVLLMAMPLLAACNGEDEIAEKETTSSFRIDGANSVPFELFSVLTAGTIQAEVNWTGASDNLSVVLTGRRRPHLPDPTAAYAEATGASPLVLSYDVSEEDLDRGVGWRLAIYDVHGAGDAEGAIRITTPYDAALEDTFEKEKVSLRSGDLWPSAELQAQFLDSLAVTSAKGLHSIISLHRPLTCEEQWHFQRQGLIRQSFLPGYDSFAFTHKGVNLADPDIAPLVRAITPLEPEDKVGPHILLRNYSRFVVTPPGEPPQNYVLNDDGTVELSILFARDVSLDRIGAILSAESLSFSAITDDLWQGTFVPDKVVALAAYDEVEWVEAGPEPRLYENDNTRQFINVDNVQDPQVDAAGNLVLVGGLPNYNGLTGAGITAGVDDSGIDAGHPDLNVVATINPNAPAGSHGTHVAGSIAASGLQSNQNNALGNPNLGTPFQWRGMAPEAGLIDSGDLINAANLLNAIQNSSLDLSNHSHSLGNDGNYNANNRTVDQEILGETTSGGTTLPPRLQIYSAGNNGAFPWTGNQQGYFAITKQLKNALVCGNWDALNNDLAQGSSMGPAHDGRIKPDLVAPGTNVVSTGTVGDGDCIGVGNNLSSGYDDCSGTSMASAAVTGGVALLLESWHDTYSTPLGTTIDANAPFPSTLRALVIQTANDRIHLNVRNADNDDVDADNNPANGNDGLGNPSATAGPDFATGWGLIDIQAAVGLVQDTRVVNGLPIPNRIIQDAMGQGRIVEYDFVVDEPGPLRVTLAWDDVEGAVQNPATNPMLVNDLDLELEAPDGTIHYPWQLGQDILDSNGNPLADNAQPPGTNIQVVIPITPTANPAANDDYVPANALAVGGDWAAGQGKDHLNNIEQVFLQNVGPGQIGHWTLRVIGFDIPSGAQEYSVVGFPYPDLAELQVFSDDRVGLAGFDQDMTFTWTATNIGPIATGEAGETFEYQILLSSDFYLGDDEVLVDSAQTALDPLASGGSIEHTSTVQITQANANALLGRGPGDPDATIDDLLNEDVFLIAYVDSADDVLEHNEMNIIFVQLARLVDVVLVLDRSGSMSGLVPVSNAASREKIDVLKASANLFLDLMRLDAGDQLAEVSFSGAMGANSITTDFGPTGELTAIGAANIDDAKSAVNALDPGLQTDIHGALQQGLDVLTAAEAGDHRRVLIFFSDGERTTGGDPTEETFLQQFDDADVHVYSVGFGTPGGAGYQSIDVELLQTLANTGEPGFFHVTERAEELDKFFVNAVAGATLNDVILDPVGDVAPGQTHSVAVPLTEQDSGITFVLTWDNPALSLNLALRSPSGLVIDSSNAGLFGERVSLVDAATYKLMKVDFPLLTGPSAEHNGTWQMIIGNPSGATVRYSASAIGESTIHVQMLPMAPTGGGSFLAGDSIPLQTVVRQHDATPVSTAVITVTPNVPLVGLGDLLSSVAITEKELDEIPDEINGDALSLHERMILALQKRLGGGNPLPRADAEPFELDPGKKPGEFAGVFPETSISGVYSFTVSVDGLADCQLFQREVSRSVTVSAAVDAKLTTVTVVTPDPGQPGSVTVVVTPVSTGGGLVGPGFASGVQIDGGTRLAPTSEVTDNLDGSYSRSFRARDHGTTVLSIRVLGVELPPIQLDTRLPVLAGVTPHAVSNDVAHMITVSVGQGAEVSPVTGISLVLGDQRFSLEEIGVNPKDNTAQALIPAGLQPGLYRVYLESEEGQGTTSNDAVVRVIGHREEFPQSVQALGKALDDLLAASTDTEGLAHIYVFLRSLRATPTGASLTEELKSAAVNQATHLLMKGKGKVAESDISAILDAVNASKRDAQLKQ